MAISRRRLLQSGLAAGVAGVGMSRFRSARADIEGPRYLVVLGCFGGASMIDCFMPIDSSEAFTHANRGTVLSHATTRPGDGGIRCVDRSTPRDFLSRYGQHTVAMGVQASSVNHFVGQSRAINGRDSFRGRSLGEAVSAVYGGDMALPNVNMGRGGYLTGGVDGTLPPRFRAEVVTNPVTYALSTHGNAGLLPLGELAVQDPDTRARMMQRARALRDEQLEHLSPFGQTFANSRIRRDLLWGRQTVEPRLEVDRLIERLLYVPDLGQILPLSEYGLSSSSESRRVRDYLPDAMPTTTSGIAGDRLQAQAALAYLLLRTGASCSVTLTEPGTDGFLAFDQSHQDHRSAQATHWDRVLNVADRLIGLLSTAEYVDESGATGTSLWDRTMIVFATEFGRDKWDIGGRFGTGHHLNNGLLMVSPMLAGGQTLGEPDPNNGFICGFDTDTGAPTPFDGLEPGQDPLFSDERLPPSEEQAFGAVLDVLGVGFEGQQTIPVITRT